MAEIIGPPANVTRNRPITAELSALLNGAADATGIQKVVIFSGGQTSNHAPHLKGVVGGWIGSPRHDDGRAADVHLVKDGTTLRFTDADGSEVEAFVTAAAARGATGIGAGLDYMGPTSIHVGFGKSPSDHQKLVWGEDGLSVNAPGWLRQAAAAGWNNPIATGLEHAFAALAPGRSMVMARGGLWLRKGPGIEFDRGRLLDAGTVLAVVGFDGEWARVDLEGDGRVDGHVHTAFLAPADGDDSDEGVEETPDVETQNERAGAGGPAGDGLPRDPRPSRASRRRQPR
jgi:hypothetical protein